MPVQRRGTTLRSSAVLALVGSIILPARSFARLGLRMERSVSVRASSGLMFFTATDPSHGDGWCGGPCSELWATDGTEAGTTLVKDIWPGTKGSRPTWLTAVGATVFFAARDPEHGRELWKSDGTEAGTVLVRDIIPGSEGPSFGPFVAAGDLLFFELAWTGELWRSDGTEAGTYRVSASETDELASARSTAYFRARDDLGHGDELWKSDGTVAGTLMVRDIWPGARGSDPEQLTDVDGELSFLAADRAHGLELWKSDGTSKGTVLVRDIWPGRYSSRAFELTPVGSRVFFTADDGRHGRELWRSDGTERGTWMVKDLLEGPEGSQPWAITDVGGTLFLETAGEDRTALWTSDGKRGDASFVRAVPDCGTDHVGVGVRLIFLGADARRGCELWASDGTAAGTRIVKDVGPGKKGVASPYSTVLAGTDRLVYFRADDGIHGMELWVSDGTRTGTTILSDIWPGSEGSWPWSFAYVS